MREQFNQLVAKYTTSVVTKADTSLEDIEKEYNIIRFNPSEKVVDVQKAIIKDNIVKLDNKTITIDYVISSISKLRQVSRGFILDNNKNVSKLSNTPYKMFEEFINDRASRTPYIVWYCYNYEIQELVKTLDPSIKRWVLNGGLSKNAQTEMIQGFKASDSGVMFIQYGVGKNGLTLTNCHNMVFFSLEDNNESFTQAQDRIHRIGQKEKKVNYYIFQCRGTIDEQIYQSLINKNNMLESLKAWIRSNKDV
jgi:SNF2 family DNA or RNA helicase